MALNRSDVNFDAESQHTAIDSMPDSSITHWSHFYENFPLKAPSPFAGFVTSRLQDEKAAFIDFGCGNLRDTNHFARTGREVLAIDQIYNIEYVDPDVANKIQHIQLDLSDEALAERVKDFALDVLPDEIVAYGRFILHAMSPEIRRKFLNIVFDCKFITWYAFEFRTPEDARAKHLFEDHKRYFFDVPELINFVRQWDDLEIAYDDKNTGLAPFRGEDPVVGRVIIKRKKKFLAKISNEEISQISRQQPPSATEAFPIGRIEKIGEHEICGWALANDGSKKTVVTLYLDGIRIMSVKTGLPRPELAGFGLAESAGFCFPVSSGLRGITRKGAQVTVTVGDKPLPLGRRVRGTVPFGAQYSEEIMNLVFSNGFVPAIKHGALYRPISARPNYQIEALSSYKLAREHLRSLNHEDFLVAFGSLLGLWRDGKLIAHDDDFDGLIVIRAETIDSFIEQYLQLLSTLRSERCEVEAYEDGLHFSLVIKGGIPIDCFVGWFDGTDLLAFHTVLSCEAHDLIGSEMPDFPGIFAPVCTVRLLEHWYGDGWQTPDPHFQWELKPELRGRFEEFARQVRNAISGLHVVNG